jgi:hypothetical protein
VLTHTIGKTPIAGATDVYGVAGDPDEYTAITDASGVARFKYRIPSGAGVGTRTITAVFAGNQSHFGSNGTRTLTVNRAPVDISIAKVSGAAGATVNAVATIVRSGDKVPVTGVTLAFTAFGTTVSGVTNALGQATVAITIPPATVAGQYPMTVSFAGDALHLSGTKSRNVVVR